VVVQQTAASVSATLSGNRTLTVGAAEVVDTSSTAAPTATFAIVTAIAVGEQQVLASPATFSTPGLEWVSTAPPVVVHDQMAATITSGASSADGAVSLNSTVVVNYDGFVDVTLVRCAFSDRNLHSRMPLDPMHVRLKQTFMRPMAFLSGVYSSYRMAL
jgi:hypothetical protein